MDSTSFKAEVAEFNRLNEVTSRLWTYSTFNEGLEEILDAAISLLHTDYGNVQLLDGEKGSLSIMAQRGFESDFLETFKSVSIEGNSACARALRLGEVVIIEDTETDPLFTQYLPFIRSADFRAVTSLPLFGQDKRVLGIISVHFRNPHRPSERDLRWLQMYAVHAARFIERWQMDAIRQIQSDSLHLAITGVGLGYSCWNLTKKQLICSLECCDHLNLPAKSQLSFEDLLVVLHADDRIAFEQGVSEALRERGQFSADMRVTWMDGSTHWISNLSQAGQNNDGDVVMTGITRDITKKRQSEEAEREKRARYRALVEVGSDAVFLMSPDFKELRYLHSGTFLANCSNPSETWLNNYFPEDEFQRLDSFVAECLSTQKPAEHEHRIYRKDGMIGWSHSRLMPLFDESGKVHEWIGMAFDITDKRRALAEVQRMRLLLEEGESIGRMGTWEFIPETNQTIWSAGMYRLCGWDSKQPSPLLSEWMASCIHPEDFKRVDQIFKDAIEHKTAFEAKFRILRPEGSIRHTKSRAKPVESQYGAELKFVGNTVDLTDQIEAREALKDFEMRFEQAMEFTNQGVWEWDERRGSSYFSPGYHALLGFQAEELAPQFETWIDRLHPDDRDAVLKEVFGKIQSDDLYDIDFRLRHRLGHYIWVNGRGRVLGRDHEGKAQHAIGTFIDITERREIQGKLEELNRSLETQVMERTRQADAANRAKTEFLANMSHEIRNPLNNINILVHLLSKSCVSSDRMLDQHIRRIGSNVTAVTALVDDVLDFSKIEAGQIRLEAAPFSLDQLFARLREMYDESAKTKGLDLHWPGVPHNGLLIGDIQRLQQILGNLLSNAIKFTSQGGIWVKVEVVREDYKDLSLRFEVADSGIGIEIEALSSLLEPFMQADSTITRRFGGTGLGLSISSRLINLMGGKIDIKSTPGLGSRFSFVLPFEKGEVCTSEEGCGSKGQGNRLLGLNLLLVDDDAEMLNGLASLLEAEGARTRRVHNGKEAYDWLLSQGSACDAILMDIQMPVMDGITATRLIRGKLGFVRLPIYALTAGILPDQQSAALDAGITEMLRKPVDLGILTGRLALIQRAQM